MHLNATFSLLLSVTLFLLPILQVNARFISRQPPTVQKIPSAPSKHPVTAQFTSSAQCLDAPHLSAVNETAGEWWYFDVVSTAQAHVVVVFFASSNISFPFLGPVDGVTTVTVEGTFENGTVWGVEIPATEAVVTSEGNGASGAWKGTGVTFSGSPDLSEYAIEINIPDAGIKGSISFKSIAPAHYACGPATAGQNMKVTPWLGWSNAIPDAIAQVNLDIAGTPLTFEGLGYHDQNWGIANIFTGVASWYWGHARFGPYSFVWFDILNTDGSENAGAYIAQFSSNGGGGGKIVAIDCNGPTTKARPFGKNAAYPPYAGGGVPTGWTVTAELGKEGTLEVKVTTKLVVANEGGEYIRVLSDVSAGIKGEKARWTGSGINEAFALVPNPN